MGATIYVWNAGGENWRRRPPDYFIETTGGESDALYEDLAEDPGVDHVEIEHDEG